MTAQEELIMFARLRQAGGAQFEQWLSEAEATSVKTMAAGEGAMMHRAQGRYGFIAEMKKMLHASKDVR